MSEELRSRPRRVVMIASEVESLARTGGLGDVVEALSLALADLGLDVLVVTPRYGITRVPERVNRWPHRVGARWGWGPGDVASLGVLELDASRFPSGGTRRICLLESDALFGRAGIYGDQHGPFGDNALRFAVMSRGALEVADRVWPDGPDVIHAHDWHATFAVLYARLVMGERWARIPSVFTVHNLQFQGVLDEGALDRLHLPREAWRHEVLLHEGQLNLMKGATAHADRITTVSPTYAREILGPSAGFGLDHHLRAHAQKLVGILNGIDVVHWDPRTDAALTARFGEHDAKAQRAANKAALLAELGLEAHDGPVFGLVARLSWQKGIDLVLPLFPELVAQGASIVVVGEGDRPTEDHLRYLAESRPGRIGVRIAFDPALSRRVYAGSDFFLVPSRFEPCGLTQMYAMRYGSIPVVTDVGGLHDTVEPILGADAAAAETGTGFVAPHASTPDIREACLRATRLYDDARAHERAVARAMARSDRFAWTESAQKYRALYEGLRAP
ncbi:MAG TPA: glycogen/starch synthase [Labilithrix sp.]|nr:glycogen/starch synthase [Labilithrix sp.]